MTIMLSLAKYLAANEAITAMAGEIRPVVLADGICDPAVVYALANKINERLLDSSVGTLMRASVELLTYSATYETVRTMANTIRSEMEPHIGPFGDHTAKLITFEAESDSYAGGLRLYTVSQNIEIWYHVPD